MNEGIKDIMFSHGVDDSQLDSLPRTHAIDYDLCIHPRGTHPKIYVTTNDEAACVGVRDWDHLDEQDWFVRPRGVRELVDYAQEQDWFVEGDPDNHLPTPDDFL